MYTIPPVFHSHLGCGEHFRDDKKKKKRKKSAKATLSFAVDDEGDPDDSSSSSTPAPTATPEDEPPAKRAKFGKNPNVDTSFLPDREREESERLERERLRQEWIERQDDIKAEEIEVVYSYWDGSGHRKSVMVSSLVCGLSNFS